MLPESWLSLAFFAFLVAPGLFFDLLASRRRVGAAESTFREISRVVLASTIFSCVGLITVALVSTIQPSWMPDARQLLTRPDPYVYDHPARVIGGLSIQLVVALGTALAVHVVLARRAGSTLRRRSTWRQVLRLDLPPGTVPFARVRLASGAVYIGRVGHYTADLSVGDRELVLIPPIASRKGSATLTPLPTSWQRVVLRGSEIESMAIEYRRVADAIRAAPKSS